MKAQFVHLKPVSLWFVIQTTLLLSFLSTCSPIAGESTPMPTSTNPVVFDTQTPTQFIEPTITLIPYPVVTQIKVSAVLDIYPYPPASTPLPTKTLAPTPTNPNAYKPECESGPMYTKCEDAVLGATFEYPTVWGEIIGELLQGGDAGFRHDYTFENSSWGMKLVAGGRSSDFAEGRGAYIADFLGYDPILIPEDCPFSGRFCWEVKPGVLIVYAFPEAQFICHPAPELNFSPRIVVALNLPAERSIHGFLFTTGFLSTELKIELMSTLGASPRFRPNKM